MLNLAHKTGVSENYSKIFTWQAKILVFITIKSWWEGGVICPFLHCWWECKLIEPRRVTWQHRARFRVGLTLDPVLDGYTCINEMKHGQEYSLELCFLFWDFLRFCTLQRCYRNSVQGWFPSYFPLMLIAYMITVQLSKTVLNWYSTAR